MTQTSGPTAGPAPATGLDRFFNWIRSVDVRRDTDDKWLAGVCSGIASRLGVDPIVIRAVLVLLVVMGGVGVTVYLIAWAFLPNNQEEIVAERALRDGDVLGIILLVLIGLSLIGGTGIAGDAPGGAWIWWVAVPVGLVVWLVVRKGDHGSARPAQSSASATAPGYAPLVTEPGAQSGTTSAGAPAAPAAAPPGGPHDYSPPPPTARRPPKPPKAPRRRSGGFAATLLIGGLALAAYGLASWAHQANDWSGSEQTVGLCAALAVVGLGTLVLGVAGRRAGFTGFIAVVLALVTWTASVVPDVTFGGGVGERIWRPSATDTSGKYRLSIGSAELDLARAQDNPGTPRQIDARVGIGELKVFVPDNLTVEVRSSVAAGDISRAEPEGFARNVPPLDGSNRVDLGSSDGPDGRDVSTVETFGEGAPDVVVDAHVGFGQILIGKE